MQLRHKHIPELQSLRGIAAVVVLLHHSTFAFKTGDRFHYWAEVLLNAHAAVILFFVLSGYVLFRSLSLVETNIGTLTRFYIARIFRIYPAVWFACALALVVLRLTRSHFPASGASSLFLAAYPVVGFWAVIKSFCFASGLLIPPMWSVRVELIGSLALPFIALAIRRGLGLWLLFAAVAASLAPVSVKSGIPFIPCFVVGALAFKYQTQLGHFFASPPAIASSTLLLLFFRRIDSGWRFETSYNAMVPLLVESLAAAILIVGLVERGSHSLSSRPAVRLGDISYSVYLLHFPILASLMYVVARIPGNGDFRAIVLMAATSAITLPMAAIVYNAIELPGIALGKRFYAAIA
ncbi:MAG TPA: acyltransferase [Acidobacteriaceae bacterium]|nr:acyltransferase [Acidobacteriaceae bacterium]